MPTPFWSFWMECLSILPHNVSLGLHKSSKTTSRKYASHILGDPGAYPQRGWGGGKSKRKGKKSFPRSFSTFFLPSISAPRFPTMCPMRPLSTPARRSSEQNQSFLSNSTEEPNMPRVKSRLPGKVRPSSDAAPLMCRTKYIFAPRSY